MMHQLNESTSLASKRKAVHYPPDGTGRDAYIQTDNGGTNIGSRCQGVPELGAFMKFGGLHRTFKPASTTHFQRYTSDGTGRDNYVMYVGDNIDLIREASTMRRKRTARCCWNSGTPWETEGGRGQIRPCKESTTAHANAKKGRKRKRNNFISPRSSQSQRIGLASTPKSSKSSNPNSTRRNDLDRFPNFCHTQSRRKKQSVTFTIWAIISIDLAM